MKPADPARDYRDVVLRGYDAVAGAFNAARAREAGDELAPLLEVLPPRATVLDLGCGTGVPVARALAGAGHGVVGLDLSAGQLALARRQAPGASFVRGDMARCAFREASFDAVVSLYAIFHLPHAEHGPLFGRIARWLRPGGWLLATLSEPREDGYTEDFFGAEMYWSNLSLPEYRALLEGAGFAIVREGVTGHGYDDPDAKPERHPLVLAQRRIVRG